MENFEVERAEDPIALFAAWLTDAEASEPNDANAAALGTATVDGAPSVRMVLVKRVDARGFAFFTNAESRKGVELAANPRAAMCFHWKSLRRQVRVEGVVSELPGADSDAYFRTRSRMSQLSAVASQQSRVLGSREELEARVHEIGVQYPNEVPRPSYWKGYVLRPERMEFWLQGIGRMHDRFLFVRAGDDWTRQRLFP
ncbi:pyridoxine/pyridoxamine 5'-phosphate oxidase [Edaphobacter acidisoli]|uniref:Pyridoxamine 5'-phosphate oxidase n=1 Tax=Edaphobacter acidisoli TaxID=2040573 RepID=A0A916RFE3_9BACT|nr:pyridoxamine 5'-phosphate oxidase [Edaphobacter acidisoli]GGA53996.1 pyridoxine/pyridoxamine 5'-phosphate oxidase [Edaphobacter acidisoli]